jgi:hypothetical protein
VPQALFLQYSVNCKFCKYIGSNRLGALRSVGGTITLQGNLICCLTESQTACPIDMQVAWKFESQWRQYRSGWRASRRLQMPPDESCALWGCPSIHTWRRPTVTAGRLLIPLSFFSPPNWRTPTQMKCSLCALGRKCAPSPELPLCASLLMPCGHLHTKP